MLFPRFLSLLILFAPFALGERVFLSNTTGSIEVRIVKGDRLAITKNAMGRAVLPTDVVVQRRENDIDIACDPKDGTVVDMVITLPLGLPFRAETVKGRISVEGLAGPMDLFTDSGDIRIAVPWSATKLSAQSSPGVPREFNAPEGYKFDVKTSGKKEIRAWWVTDRLPARRITYGYARIQAKNPGKIDLVDIPYPADAAIKMPWHAVRLVDEMLRTPDRAQKKAVPAAPAVPESTANPDGTVTFRSDVRVVALSASVMHDGRPIPGLKPEQFEVLEDGVPQDVRIAGNEEAPFNLALLLDLSGSTQQERNSMQEAAKRFYGIARPEDRVAVYALAESLFMVLSPLTANRDQLVRALRAVPAMSGGSPVYDTIVLAYTEELNQRPNERNALIVISDGMDNQIEGKVTPSEVSFPKLLRAAESWNALVYPIYLDPFSKLPPPSWAVKAKKQMSSLADATGGKLFTASGLRDLEPVYSQVAEELRSVYSITYTPKNQNFDGAWRRVQVRVKERGAIVRTRAGYFAR
ncbi:MAG: VWA domain-containing protein [Acidobacteria bacterium]|nr:VWA domain-containing protein [Acidobacteriota bacterium]